jgi:hypothetical protein
MLSCAEAAVDEALRLIGGHRAANELDEQASR